MSFKSTVSIHNRPYVLCRHTTSPIALRLGPDMILMISHEALHCIELFVTDIALKHEPGLADYLLLQLAHKATLTHVCQLRTMTTAKGGHMSDSAFARRLQLFWLTVASVLGRNRPRKPPKYPRILALFFQNVFFLG